MKNLYLLLCGLLCAAGLRAQEIATFPYENSFEAEADLNG
jgi:hypothetical protein